MKVYSYHTFVLPFIWEQADKCHQKDIDSFAYCFKSNPNWKSVNMEETYKLKTEETFSENDDVFSHYNEYQYFYPFVRDVLYGYKASVVRNFSFMPADVHNKAEYHIYKTYNKAKENGKAIKAVKHYLLHINGIKLKIYNTGVALFILECENHGKDGDGKPQNTLNDVKNINDYGRRITLPFIPCGPDYSSVCADKLSVVIPEKKISFEDDFLAFAKSLNAENSNAKTISGKISMNHICDYIKEILSYGSDEFYFTSKKPEHETDVNYKQDPVINGKTPVYIHPALDDRMFVASIVIDAVETDKMREEKDGDFAFLNDAELSRSLYQLAFIDPGKLNYDDSITGNCTCRSDKMRKKLLDEHVYDRWTEYKSEGYCGTLYTVANQGLIALGNYYDDAKIINPFLTEYVQMCCLCLMQKSTLIHLQDKASEVSDNIEKPGKNISRKTITRLMNLQERFVAYQSQLSFTEVTAQEQGIEIYDLLRKFMFIEKETETLADRLEKLEAASETNLDFKFNKIALIFTLVAFFLSVCGDFLLCFIKEDGTWLFGNSSLFTWLFAIIITCVTVSFLVIMYLYRRRKK